MMNGSRIFSRSWSQSAWFENPDVSVRKSVRLYCLIEISHSLTKLLRNKSELFICLMSDVTAYLVHRPPAVIVPSLSG
jgi:hypothetical protein